MNQLACNSPHFVFWVGKKNINVQSYFWSELNKIVEKKFSFDEIHVVDKYTNLIENVINQKNFQNLKTFKNNLYIIEALSYQSSKCWIFDVFSRKCKNLRNMLK